MKNSVVTIKAKIIMEINSRRDLYTVLLSDKFVTSILEIYQLIKECIDSGGKILLFGNGGSAAEAQHFAAELVCKFEKVRKPIAAIALTTDSSILTAQSNDFGFHMVFARQIEALARPGDLVIGFTTSDPNQKHNQSRNIIEGFNAAKAMGGVKRIGFFGAGTDYLLGGVDAMIIAPSDKTSLIQEVHLFAIHELCRLIEEDIC
ncbi:MAG TPA: SIS domain-containing protein [Candidatus Paceibacterota bacterium]